MLFSNDSKYEELVTKLTSNNNMTNSERINLINSTPLDDHIVSNILINYYSKHILSDGELLVMIEMYRKTNKIPNTGLSGGDLSEVSIMMMGLKSPQYERFFRHILTQYNISVNPVDDNEMHDCCVCWRRLKGNRIHDRVSDPSMTMLAFTGAKTHTCICINCLCNLVLLTKLLVDLKDNSMLKSLEWIRKQE